MPWYAWFATFIELCTLKMHIFCRIHKNFELLTGASVSNLGNSKPREQEEKKDSKMGSLSPTSMMGSSSFHLALVLLLDDDV